MYRCSRVIRATSEWEKHDDLSADGARKGQDLAGLSSALGK